MAISNVTEEQIDILTGAPAEPALEPVPETAISDPLVTDAAIAPEAIPVPEIDPEGVQVAGLKDDIVTGIAKRVAAAEKKVIPPLPDKPVQDIGGRLIVREASPEEVADFNRAAGGEYTKGINFPQIAENLGDFDLGQYIDQIKTSNAELFEKARRGTLNFDALLKLAEEQGADNLVVEWLQRSPGDGETAEKVLGGMLAAMQTSKETQGAFELARGLPVGDERTAALSKAKQLMTVEAMLYANLSGAGSEAGRTMYMLREAQRRLGMENVGERADELINLFGAENTQDLEYLGDLYMALPKNARGRFVQQGLGAKTMDVIAEVWINSILTSPATHMVNIAGNSMFYGTRMAETALAGTVGKARTALGLGGKERVRTREALIQMQAIQESWKDALTVAGKTLLTEETGDVASKIDLRNRRAIGTTGDPRMVMQEIRQGNFGAAAVNALGIYFRLGGRFLLAEDQFFKGIGYRSALRQEAYTRGANMYDQAIEAGKTADEAKAAASAEEARILTNPPVGIVENAQDAARELTFQGDLPGRFGQDAFSHPVAKLFVPFYKTPMNIMKETAKRSPLMLAYPGFYKKIAAGGRQADMAIAQFSMGSLIMGGFAATSMGLDTAEQNIIIMGSGPTDPKAKQAMQRKKMQQFSVNIKQEDGTYLSIPYSRLDPISGMLAMSADFAYYAQYEDDQSVLDSLAMAATLGISQYAMEMPFLQGVSELTAIFRNPDPKVMADEFMKMLGEKPTEAVLSLAPGVSSFSAGIERMQDPTVSSYLLPEDLGDPTQMPAFMRGFYTALQKAKARHPFFSDQVPPRLNLWGEKMQAGEGAGWEFVSPIRIQQTKYAPVDDELMRLGGGVPMHPKKIDGVVLNAEPYNEWITLTNQLDSEGKLPGQKGYDVTSTLLPTLVKEIKGKEYKTELTDDDRLDYIRSIVGLYRKAAKNILLEANPDLAKRVLAVQ